MRRVFDSRIVCPEATHGCCRARSATSSSQLGDAVAAGVVWRVELEQAQCAALLLPRVVRDPEREAAVASLCDGPATPWLVAGGSRRGLALRGLSRLGFVATVGSLAELPRVVVRTCVIRMMATISELVAGDGRATQQVQRSPRRIALHLAPTLLASKVSASVPTPPRSSGLLCHAAVQSKSRSPHRVGTTCGRGWPRRRNAYDRESDPALA